MRHLLACVVTIAFMGCSSGDGTKDASGVDAPAGDCGGLTCGAQQICVRTQTSGGPCLRPEDGAACPNGSTFSGVCCVSDPAFACAARPSGCGATVDCACAAATLCVSGHTCSTPVAGRVDCTLLAP
jgi:hypothetical protein